MKTNLRISSVLRYEFTIDGKLYILIPRDESCRQLISIPHKHETLEICFEEYAEN